MYSINNLSFYIENKAILEDISLNIKANNFLSIIGPNGSGKSTLIKLINKNLDNYKGEITLLEKDIKEYSSKTLSLHRAVLNQSFNFNLNFKVLDIIEMGLNFHNIEIKKKREILDFVVGELNIKEFINRDYQTLSGGQQQRVQLARVITQIFIDDKKSKFLFLDEPTLNLDIHQQFIILDLVKKLVKEYNLGVCAVLHDLHQTYLYSDEVAILQNGKIKHFGTSKEVLTTKNIKDIFEVDSDIVYSEKLQKNILVTG